MPKTDYGPLERAMLERLGHPGECLYWSGNPRKGWIYANGDSASNYIAKRLYKAGHLDLITPGRAMIYTLKKGSG